MLVLDALEKNASKAPLDRIIWDRKKIFLNSAYQVEMKATLHTKLTAVSESVAALKHRLALHVCINLLLLLSMEEEI